MAGGYAKLRSKRGDAWHEGNKRPARALAEVLGRTKLMKTLGRAQGAKQSALRGLRPL